MRFLPSISIGTGSARLAPSRAFLPGVFLLVFFLAVGGGPLAPQDAAAQESKRLSEVFKAGGKQFVRGYSSSFVDVFATGIGSGLFIQSGQHEDLIGPFNLHASVRGSATAIRAAERFFSLSGRGTSRLTLSDGTTREVTYTYGLDKAATLLGDSGGRETISGTASYVDTEGNRVEEDFSFEAPPGLLGDFSRSPTATLQGGIGVPSLGTRVSVRATPTVIYEGAGRGRLLGGGVQQTLTPFFGQAFGIDISAYGYYQSLTLTESYTGQTFLRFRHYAGGANLFKSVSSSASGGLGAFLSAGVEKSAAHFDYTTEELGEEPEIVFDFAIENALEARVQGGVDLRLGPLAVTVGYAPLPRTVIFSSVGLRL